ncbi:MAG: tail fiber domain-containing protein [Melioribacteraceae bacterium]|nr:tail fiber domain-containing protein [Melioribacteraceae bacterium]
MKKLSIKFLVLNFILLLSQITAQNINNTLGASGVFTVKDNTNTFFSISQSNGTLSLISESAGNQRGSIFKGSNRFLHTYFPTSSDGLNTFLGLNSGNFSMAGSGSQSSYNTGVGYESLSSITTGSYNSAYGNSSLRNNTTGYQNSSFGAWSLISNTIGIRNCAYGFSSLNANTSGDENCSFGYYSLFSNTDGKYNSAFGTNSLRDNLSAWHNSAFGNLALRNNTLGEYNSALGSSALYSNTSGYYNTAVGYMSGFNITTGSNNIAIGYYAQVPTATANNQVRIGNAGITYAGVQVAWTVTSDRRWKDNIQLSQLGLDFISKLNPVSYTRNNDEKQKTEFGLIAQELEEVLKEFNVENTGMLTIDDNGYYHLRYNDLIAPMIKSIQELKSENDYLKTQNNELMKKLLAIEKVQMELVKLIKENSSNDKQKFVNLTER